MKRGKSMNKKKRLVICISVITCLILGWVLFSGKGKKVYDQYQYMKWYKSLTTDEQMAINYVPPTWQEIIWE